MRQGRRRACVRTCLFRLPHTRRSVCRPYVQPAGPPWGSGPRTPGRRALRGIRARLARWPEATRRTRCTLRSRVPVEPCPHPRSAAPRAPPVCNGHRQGRMVNACEGAHLASSVLRALCLCTLSHQLLLRRDAAPAHRTRVHHLAWLTGHSNTECGCACGPQHDSDPVETSWLVGWLYCFCLYCLPFPPICCW